MIKYFSARKYICPNCYTTFVSNSSICPTCGFDCETYECKYPKMRYIKAK